MNNRKDQISSAALIVIKSRSESEAKAVKKTYEQAMVLYKQAEALKNEYFKASVSHNIKLNDGIGSHQFKYDKSTGFMEGLEVTRTMIKLAEKKYLPALEWMSRNRQYVEDFAAKNTIEPSNSSLSSKL
ncbi:MAG: hypothetical protein ABI370_10710 [Gammaproteobacteria bacterium]